MVAYADDGRAAADRRPAVRAYEKERRAMKSVSIRQARDGLSARIRESQDNPMLITRHGRPVAVLIGLESRDLEAAILGADPHVWRFVERRRKGRTVSMATAKRILRID